MSFRNNLAESDRQSLRNIYTEALQSQMVVASDSIRPSTRLYKSSYRLEVAAGLVPNADVVFTRIAFQYNRDFERLGGDLSQFTRCIWPTWSAHLRSVKVVGCCRTGPSYGS